MIEPCTSIPDGMTAKVRLAMLHNEHLGLLSEYVLCSWPSMKAEVQKEL